MHLISVLIVLIVAGLIMWLVNSFIPLQSNIKKLLNAVVIIIVIFWLLNVFGLMEGIMKLHI